MKQISSENLLTPSQVEQFKADGFLAIRDFYDLKSEIIPM
jgi:hypothetical protein